MAKIDLKVGDIVDVYSSLSDRTNGRIAKDVILHHIPTNQPGEMKPFWHFEDPTSVGPGDGNFYIDKPIGIVLKISV